MVLRESKRRGIWTVGIQSYFERLFHEGEQRKAVVAGRKGGIKNEDFHSLYGKDPPEREIGGTCP